MAGSTSVELADVVRSFGAEYLETHGCSAEQRLALWSIQRCRTAELGGHLYCCDQCGYECPVYNSCRNRHCPKCQSLPTERWLETQRCNLLPVGYFHLVFTVPQELHPLMRSNPRELYDLLFRSAASTLAEVAENPKWLGARIGILAVLHTWTQTLLYRKSSPHPV